jgi:DNA polymerase-4
MWEDYLGRRRIDEEAERIGGVTVYLHRFAAEKDMAMRQQDLFADPAQRRVDQKRARLWRAIDLINADPNAKFRKLGAVSRSPSQKYVVLASQTGLALNYLGAKIAFSRVPEETEFLY